jgi:hypothetical protein
VGRDEQMIFDQPEEMTEQMSSEMDLDQQMQLKREEDRRNLLMIGGIQIFLPFSRGEAKICVADATTTEEGQPVGTVKEGLEQISEASHAGEKNEHSKEWLNIFS